MRTGTKVGLVSTLGTFGLAFAISQVKGVKPLVVPVAVELSPETHTAHVKLKNPTNTAWTYWPAVINAPDGATEEEAADSPIFWGDPVSCPAGETKTYDISGVDLSDYGGQKRDIWLEVVATEQPAEAPPLIWKKVQDITVTAPAAVSFVGISWD